MELHQRAKGRKQLAETVDGHNFPLMLRCNCIVDNATPNNKASAAEEASQEPPDDETHQCRSKAREDIGSKEKNVGNIRDDSSSVEF